MPFTFRVYSDGQLKYEGVDPLKAALEYDLYAELSMRGGNVVVAQWLDTELMARFDPVRYVVTFTVPVCAESAGQATESALRLIRDGSNAVETRVVKL